MHPLAIAGIIAAAIVAAAAVALFVYRERSYLFSLFGGLQGKVVEDARAWCAEHPGEHVVTPWVPRDWTRGMYDAAEGI